MITPMPAMPTIRPSARYPRINTKNCCWSASSSCTMLRIVSALPPLARKRAAERGREPVGIDGVDVGAARRPRGHRTRRAPALRLISTPLLAKSLLPSAATVNVRSAPLARSRTVNWSPMPTCCAGGPLPRREKELVDDREVRVGEHGRVRGAVVGVRAAIVELGRPCCDERRVEGGPRPQLAACVRPGARTICRSSATSGATARTPELASRARSNGTGLLGFDDDHHVEAARRVARELAELAREHRADHRHVHEDEHDEREHAERHRGAEPARQRIRETEPDRQRALGDAPDRVADRTLLLRHEHDRRADEHQALRDEQEHVDAAVQRERDRHRDHTPQQHDDRERRRDRSAREVARERGADARRTRAPADHQRRRTTRRSRRAPVSTSPTAASARPAVERARVRPVRRRLGDVADRPDDVEAAQPDARDQHRDDRDHEADHEAPLHARPREREVQREPVARRAAGRGAAPRTP